MNQVFHQYVLLLNSKCMLPSKIYINQVLSKNSLPLIYIKLDVLMLVWWPLHIDLKGIFELHTSLQMF